MILPVGHRILVRRFQLEERDEVFKNAARAGIVLSEKDKQQRDAGVDQGEVLEVGPDAFKQFYLSANGTLEGFKPWCAVGDVIYIAKYAGKAITEGGVDYIVINDEDVISIKKE